MADIASLGGSESSCWAKGISLVYDLKSIQKNLRVAMLGSVKVDAVLLRGNHRSTPTVEIETRTKLASVGSSEHS